MPKAYSLNLRERAVSRVMAGESVRSVEAVLNISVSILVKWLQRYQATGSAAPGGAVGRPPPSLLRLHRAWLLERIGSSAHDTLRGLQAELAERGKKVDLPNGLELRPYRGSVPMTSPNVSLTRCLELMPNGVSSA